MKLTIGADDTQVNFT